MRIKKSSLTIPDNSLIFQAGSRRKTYCIVTGKNVPQTFYIPHLFSAHSSSETLPVRCERWACLSVYDCGVFCQPLIFLNIPTHCEEVLSWSAAVGPVLNLRLLGKVLGRVDGWGHLGWCEEGCNMVVSYSILRGAECSYKLQAYSWTGPGKGRGEIAADRTWKLSSNGRNIVQKQSNCERLKKVLKCKIWPIMK